MTNQDYRVFNAMSMYGGSFVKGLAALAYMADDENLLRIKCGWPEYYKKYLEMAELHEKVERERAIKQISKDHPSNDTVWKGNE